MRKRKGSVREGKRVRHKEKGTKNNEKEHERKKARRRDKEKNGIKRYWGEEKSE